jgi:hypothetical protein
MVVVVVMRKESGAKACLTDKNWISNRPYVSVAAGEVLHSQNKE